MHRALALSCLLLVLALPALAERDMSGCTVELLGPVEVNPGETVVFELMVCNYSPDNEWTTNVIFTLPDCFTILDGWWDDYGDNAEFDVVIDPAHVISFLDADGGWGEIYQDYCYPFYVQATVGADCPSGPAEILWEQQGDGFGEEPHSISGAVAFTIGGTATEASSWSSIKSLY